MKLEEYFEIEGTYELVDGVYNVKGSVKLNQYVDNHFWCDDNLKSSKEFRQYMIMRKLRQ